MIRNESRTETVALEGDVYCKLDEPLTEEMLAEGRGATATVWTENPLWGREEDAEQFIETNPPIKLYNVVSADKETTVFAEKLVLVRKIGAGYKIWWMACQ